MRKERIADLNKDFQPYPGLARFEPNADEINRTCDKLITELSGIQLRIAAIENLTACHGPAIDAGRSIGLAIKCLQRQKR